MKKHFNQVLGPPLRWYPSEQERIIQSWTLDATGDETQKWIYCGPIVKTCRLGGTHGGCLVQHLHKAGPVTSGCSGTCPVMFWTSLKSSAEYWWSQYMYQSFAESCLLLWHFSFVPSTLRKNPMEANSQYSLCVLCQCYSSKGRQQR